MVGMEDAWSGGSRRVGAEYVTDVTDVKAVANPV